MTPSEILQKHEDANEMHFHEVDRKWIIEAMEEYATSSQTEISDEEIEKYAKSINPYPSTKQGSVDWENGFIRAIQWYRLRRSV